MPSSDLREIMTDFAHIKTLSDVPSIAVVTIDNPPVNAMSVGVPRAIIDAIDEVKDMPAVEAILLRASGSGVLSGADIKMQGKIWPADEPNLIDVINAIENTELPIGILLARAALGGGLEIALSCRYRIAVTGTLLGQPEVKLGIPPGAGATQRLPRLVGVKNALQMIVSGESVSTAEAHRMGLVDEVVENDGATKNAVRCLAAQIGSQRLRTRSSERPIGPFEPEMFDQERARAAKKYRGQRSPQVCIDCVEAATVRPFEEGVAFERERFLECVASEEASALRHVFFAERQARNIPGLSKDASPRSINSAAVIGAGTMGAGIAICFANAGISVTLLERDEAALNRGNDSIAANYTGQVSAGRLTQEEADKRLALVTPSLEFDDLAEADIIVEAVFEDMKVKKSVFSDIAARVKSGAILASNTSYLDLNEIASVTGRDEDVVGLHFFSPAHIMKLLEIVRGDATSDEALSTALSIGQRLGKISVVAAVGHGFIGNRLYGGYVREAEFLLQEGATCAQIDGALEDFGMAMGPFAVRDLAGLDIGWAMRKATAHLRKPDERYSTIGDMICERGWFGRKTGKGFYVYEDGVRKTNPDIANIIEQSAAEARITRVPIDDEEIVQRCLYPIVNDGARVLEEKIAIRSSDIDLVFIHGYGFPRWRGGPMHWGDCVGLGKIVSRIQEQSSADDIAPILKRLATEGRTFSDFDMNISK